MTKRPAKRTLLTIFRRRVQPILRPEIIAMMVEDLSRFAGKSETLNDDIFAFAADTLEGFGLRVGRRQLAEYAATIAAHCSSGADPKDFTEWAARLWLERHK